MLANTTAFGEAGCDSSHAPTIPLDVLGYFSYGNLHPRLNTLPKNIIKFLTEHPKISVRTINLYTKMAPNFTRTSSNYLHL